MTWGEALENINYWAVIVAAAASLVIGFTWYHWNGFGKEWSKLVGLKQKDMESRDGMAVNMAASVIFYFLTSLVMACLLLMTNMQTGGEGVLMGAIVGFVYAFGPLAVTYGYAMRKFELTMIDGGYMVVTIALQGLIIGAW